MALGISARGATLKYGGEPKPTRYTIKPKLRLKLNFKTYFGESRGVWKFPYSQFPKFRRDRKVDFLRKIFYN